LLTVLSLCFPVPLYVAIAANVIALNPAISFTLRYPALAAHRLAR